MAALPMNVRIDKTGSDNQPRGIDRFLAGDPVRGYFRDPIAYNSNE